MRLLILLLTVAFSAAASPPRVVSSSTSYGGTSLVRLRRPSGMQIGDLLVLFLSRSDGKLPLYLDGWTTRASCFKDKNNQELCDTHDHCVLVNPDGYCDHFPNHRNGKDLATVAFTKWVSMDDLNRKEYFYNLNGSWPGWGILSVVRGAVGSIDADAGNATHPASATPIRNVTGTSCDHKRKSIFPTSYGAPGDLLLMHMAFDDTSFKSDFQAPINATLVNWVKGYDEAGFLYQETLKSLGNTGKRFTVGDGGPPCKDVLLTVVVKGGYTPARRRQLLRTTSTETVEIEASGSLSRNS